MVDRGHGGDRRGSGCSRAPLERSRPPLRTGPAPTNGLITVPSVWEELRVATGGENEAMGAAGAGTSFAAAAERGAGGGGGGRRKEGGERAVRGGAGMGPRGDGSGREARGETRGETERVKELSMKTNGEYGEREEKR